MIHSTSNGPLSIRIGDEKVVKGWQLLQGMRKGERKILVLQPELAYGKVGMPPTIPPNAVLCFDVEILTIQSPEPVVESPAPSPILNLPSVGSIVPELASQIQPAPVIQQPQQASPMMSAQDQMLAKVRKAGGRLAVMLPTNKPTSLEAEVMHSSSSDESETSQLLFQQQQQQQQLLLQQQQQQQQQQLLFQQQQQQQQQLLLQNQLMDGNLSYSSPVVPASNVPGGGNTTVYNNTGAPIGSAYPHVANVGSNTAMVHSSNGLAPHQQVHHQHLPSHNHTLLNTTSTISNLAATPSSPAPSTLHTSNFPANPSLVNATAMGTSTNPNNNNNNSKNNNNNPNVNTTSNSTNASLANVESTVVHQLLQEERQVHGELRTQLGTVNSRISELCNKWDSSPLLRNWTRIGAAEESGTITLPAMIQSLQRIFDENEKLRNEVNSKGDTVEQLRKKIQTLHEKNEKFIEENNRIMEERNDAMKETGEQTRKKLKELLEEKAKLERELNEAISAVSEAESKYTQLNRSSIAVRQQMETKHTAEMEEKLALLQTAQTTSSQLEKKLQVALSQLETETQHLKERDLKLEEVNRTSVTLSLDLDEKRSQIQTLEQKNNWLQSQLEEKTNSLMTQISLLEKSLLETKLQHGSAKSELDRIEATLAQQWQNKVDHEKSKALMLEQQCTVLTHQTEELKKDHQKQMLTLQATLQQQNEQHVLHLQQEWNQEKKNITLQQENTQLSSAQNITSQLNQLRSELETEKVGAIKKIMSQVYFKLEKNFKHLNKQEKALKKQQHEKYTPLTFTSEKVLEILLQEIKEQTLLMLQKKNPQASEGEEEDEEEEEEEAEEGEEEEEEQVVKDEKENKVRIVEEKQSPAEMFINEVPVGEQVNELSVESGLVETKPQAIIAVETKSEEIVEIKEAQVSTAVPATDPLQESVAAAEISVVSKELEVENVNSEDEDGEEKSAEETQLVTESSPLPPPPPSFMQSTDERSEDSQEELEDSEKIEKESQNGEDPLLPVETQTSIIEEFDPLASVLSASSVTPNVSLFTIPVAETPKNAPVEQKEDEDILSIMKVEGKPEAKTPSKLLLFGADDESPLFAEPLPKTAPSPVVSLFDQEPAVKVNTTPLKESPLFGGDDEFMSGGDSSFLSFLDKQKF
jgi:hypothetical protein